MQIDTVEIANSLNKQRRMLTGARQSTAKKEGFDIAVDGIADYLFPFDERGRAEFHLAILQNQLEKV